MSRAKNWLSAISRTSLLRKYTTSSYAYTWVETFSYPRCSYIIAYMSFNSFALVFVRTLVCVPHARSRTWAGLRCWWPHSSLGSSKRLHTSPGHIVAPRDTRATVDWDTDDFHPWIEWSLHIFKLQVKGWYVMVTWRSGNKQAVNPPRGDENLPTEMIAREDIDDFL